MQNEEQEDIAVRGDIKMPTVRFPYTRRGRQMARVARRLARKSRRYPRKRKGYSLANQISKHFRY